MQLAVEARLFNLMQVPRGTVHDTRHKYSHSTIDGLVLNLDVTLLDPK
jgi:hypothetical protein